MTRNRTITRTQSLGQFGLRPAARSAHGLDAWIFRAASEHPFEPGGVEPLCAGRTRTSSGRPPRPRRSLARAVCRACPLTEACLAVAQQRLEWGVWGGQALAKGRATTEPGNVRPSAHDTARSA